MRASLKQSLLDSPAEAGESFRYPAGSIVLCTSCAAPIAVLEQGVALGDKAGKLAQAFKPLRPLHLEALARREDIDAGVRAWARGLTPDQQRAHLAALVEFRAGDPMICPCCHRCFVQVLSVERSEVLDKAYVIELVTIPPEGQAAVAVRGKRLGAHKDWIHEHAPVVH